MLSKTNTYIRQPTGNIEYHFINGKIEENAAIRELIMSLRSASPNDTVQIFINSFGGDVYTTMEIVNAIRQCPGTVVTQADGQVASAASMIFFAGHVLNVSELSTFLVHNGDMLVGGKHSDTLLQVDHMKNTLYELFHSVYVPFLTVEEVEKVLSGVDMYLTSEQVCSRIDKALDEAQKQQEEIDADPNEQQPKRKRTTRKVSDGEKPTRKRKS